MTESSARRPIIGSICTITEPHGRHIIVGTFNEGCSGMMKQAPGTTRRIIVNDADGARFHLEIERSHVDGMAARLTLTEAGGGGAIVHLTNIELARLVVAELQLLDGGHKALDALGSAE